MTDYALQGVVADAAGHQATASVLVSVGTAETPLWGSGILQWVWPMALSTGSLNYATPTNWQTLANGLTPGSILYLPPGTYGARGTTFDWTAAGTAAAPVTLSGIPGQDRPVILGKVTMHGPWQRWTRAIFDGPTGNVGGPGPNGEAILLNLDGSHFEVSNCEVRGDQWHAGIGANATTDYRILGCYIHDNGGLAGDYRTTDSQWNTSHGCYISPSYFGLLANNVVEHNDAKGVMGRHDSHHILIVHNTIVANGRHGSEAYESTHDWVWANNIVLNNGNVKGGVGISMGGSGGSTYLQRRNVFWNNGTNGTSNWAGTGVTSEPLVADPKLMNPAVYSDHQNPSPAWDSHLLAGSPAVGYADPFYLMPTDIDGTVRGLTCGAYA